MQRAFVFLLGIVFIAGAALAQMPASKPGPELKKIDYFAGNWTSEGDLKPGPMGPGGKTTIHERAEWMEGGFFLVIHSKFTTAGAGNGTGIAFMGYDPQEKVYTYDEFNSWGEATHSKGKVEGDAWTWTNEMKMGPQTVTARYSMKIVSPTLYSYKFEISQDGKTWALVMDGKDTKNK